jgi:hypothetical protein
LVAAFLMVAGSVCGSLTAEADSVDAPDSVMVPVIDSVGLDSTVSDSLTAPIELPVDTVLFHPGGMLAAYGAVSDSINREKRLRQKPMYGLFKSMVLPGWGQFGNGRHIKAAVYFGLEVWMVVGAIHYGGQASDFRRAFDATPRDAVNLRNDYYSLYRDRQDERNKMTWFAVIVAFVSMFDAFVDAHLSGFPRNEDDQDVTLQIAPTDEHGVAARLSLRF